jgi:hypothetical protein
MGGDLTAQSEGKGTTLTFTIPLCTPREGRPSSVVAAAAAAAVAPKPEALPGALLPLESGTVHGSPPPAGVPGSRADAHEDAAATAVPPLPASASSTPPSPLPTPTGPNILVAEDDMLSQTVMRKVLNRLALRHTIVSDGAAAVEAYKHGVFDLVLMDLHSALLPMLARACSTDNPGADLFRSAF